MLEIGLIERLNGHGESPPFIYKYQNRSEIARKFCKFYKEFINFYTEWKIALHSRIKGGTIRIRIRMEKERIPQ